MTSSQSFSMIQRRMLLSPWPASPVNSDEPLCTSAMLPKAKRSTSVAPSAAAAGDPKLVLDEDGQVDFKGKAKVFSRTYDFLATILPYGVQEWEKLSIFLNFLIPKLPAPKEEDLAKGILEAIDMDSYRAEKKATLAIALPDADAEIEPVPTSGGGHKAEPEMDKLSNIIKAFNDQFGGLFNDPKAVEKRIIEVIPPKVSADPAYQNARQNSDRQNARIEHDDEEKPRRRAR